jgi:ubiquinone/menaquinone biosynthesis C-methylase UbiE
VLDAGCGNGSLSIRIAEKGFRIEAIDIAKKSLDYFRSKVKKKNIKNINIRYGSILKTDYKANSFDSVVSGEVLEHLTDDKKAIEEFYRVLKKGGICVVSVPAKIDKWDFVDEASGHVRRYKKEELSDRFEEQGFKILNCFYWGFPFTNFWHKYIYCPFLKNQMKKDFNVTNSETLIAKALKKEKVVSFFSKFFWIDMLFYKTSFGNSLLLVAKK